MFCVWSRCSGFYPGQQSNEPLPGPVGLSGSPWLRSGVSGAPASHPLETCIHMAFTSWWWLVAVVVVVVVSLKLHRSRGGAIVGDRPPPAARRPDGLRRGSSVAGIANRRPAPPGRIPAPGTGAPRRYGGLTVPQWRSISLAHQPEALSAAFRAFHWSAKAGNQGWQ